MNVVRILTWVALLGLLSSCAGTERSGPAPEVRVAIFNVKQLTLEKIENVDAKGVGQDPQLRAAAKIIQKIRPDVLVLQEIDHYDLSKDTDLETPSPRNVRKFVRAYLDQGENAISYRAHVVPNNTGILSGIDLDGNGVVAGREHRGTRDHGGDSFGYGEYPGQYSMAVLSNLPTAGISRTFQTFLWKHLDGHHMPEDFYSPEAKRKLRLSSKTHWDLPLSAEGRVFHLWISHPTPPVFDGEEDRNGRRNFDEIKFWVNYLEGDDSIYDDHGDLGGYNSEDPFIVIGDLNAQPDSKQSNYDGTSAIDQLLRHPQIQDPAKWTVHPVPHGTEGPPGYPERTTATFGDGARVDYVLPSRSLKIVRGGVFWPLQDDDPEGYRWAEEASDHRLVWVDLLVR